MQITSVGAHGIKDSPRAVLDNMLGPRTAAARFRRHELTGNEPVEQHPPRAVPSWPAPAASVTTPRGGGVERPDHRPWQAAILTRAKESFGGARIGAARLRNVGDPCGGVAFRGRPRRDERRTQWGSITPATHIEPGAAPERRRLGGPRPTAGELGSRSLAYDVFWASLNARRVNPWSRRPGDPSEARQCHCGYSYRGKHAHWDNVTHHLCLH